MAALESGASLEARDATTASELCAQFSLAAMSVGGGRNSSREKLAMLGEVSAEQVLAIVGRAGIENLCDLEGDSIEAKIGSLRGFCSSSGEQYVLSSCSASSRRVAGQQVHLVY